MVPEAWLASLAEQVDGLLSSDLPQDLVPQRASIPFCASSRTAHGDPGGLNQFWGTGCDEDAGGDHDCLFDAYAMALWPSRPECLDAREGLLDPILEEWGSEDDVSDSSEAPPSSEGQPERLQAQSFPARPTAAESEGGEACAAPGAWSRLPQTELALGQSFVPSMGAWCSRDLGWEDVWGSSESAEEDMAAEECSCDADGLQSPSDVTQQKQQQHVQLQTVGNCAARESHRASAHSEEHAETACPQWLQCTLTGGDGKDRARQLPRPALRKVDLLRQKRAEEKLAEQEWQAQMDQPTFRPRITAMAKRSARLSQGARSSHAAERAAKIIAEKQEQERQECTFRPKLSQSTRRHAEKPSGQRSILAERVAKMKAEKEEKEQEECTFQPALAATRGRRAEATRTVRTSHVCPRNYTEQATRRLERVNYDEWTFQPNISPRSRELSRRRSAMPGTR